jgi:hypothetical protein
VATRDEERLELEAMLAERLKLAEEPGYEGDLLSRGDQFILFTIGIIAPIVLLTIGWVVK